MNKLPDNPEKYNILAKMEDHFKANLCLTPCIGAELEFYLSKNIDVNKLSKIVEYPIKKEKGNYQFEINLKPSKNIAEYAQYIELVREKIKNGAKSLLGQANFSSKPYIDDYGSAMHIHLNFLEDSNVEKFAKILCYYLSDGLFAFLPKQEDWQRLDEKFMAPTYICYGGNNRTVAIRIPDSKPRRVEHRLPSANADPAQIIYVVLHSIELGLKHPDINLDYHKIHGNAFDPQYNLVKIEPSVNQHQFVVL